MTFVSSLGSSILLSLPLPFVAAIPPWFLVCNCVYICHCLFSLCFSYVSISFSLDSDICVSFRSRVFNACFFFCFLSAYFCLFFGFGFGHGKFDLGGNSHLSIAFAGVSHGKDHRGWFTGAQHIIIIIIVHHTFVWHLMGMKGITYSGNNTIRIGWIYSGKSECFCSFLILPLFCFVFCIAVLLFFFAI